MIKIKVCKALEGVAQTVLVNGVKFAQFEAGESASQLGHHCASAKEQLGPVLGQKLDRHHGLGQTLITQERGVSEHQVKLLPEISVNVQRGFVVIEMERASIGRKPLVILKQIKLHIITLSVQLDAGPVQGRGGEARHPPSPLDTLGHCPGQTGRGLLGIPELAELPVLLPLDVLAAVHQGPGLALLALPLLLLLVKLTQSRECLRRQLGHVIILIWRHHGGRGHAKRDVSRIGFHCDDDDLS